MPVADLFGRILSEPYVKPAGLHCHLGPRITSLDGADAYRHAMTSSYGHVTGAPVVAVRKGPARPIIRREIDEDLCRLT